ncbi:hypothetical protein NFI96_004946, partial [Prochilodus magdalenae]
MSNNNASTSLAVAHKAVKQLRLEASVRRIHNVKLQSRFNQQGAELRRKEQHTNRMREKLSQFTDRHRDRGA